MIDRTSGRSTGSVRKGRGRRSLRVMAAAGATAATLAGVLLASEPAAAQCAMCRTALASPEGQQMIAALRSGILLLLAAPFTLFGLVATLAVRSQRKRRREVESAQDPVTVPPSA